MLRRCLLIGGTTLLLATVWLSAKPGIVTLLDGSTTFQGDVTEDDTHVYITNKGGIQTKLDKRNVKPVEYVANAEEQFSKTLSRLAPKDVEGRIKLARWAYDQRQYNDARTALDAALKIDPNNRAATDLLDTVQKQIRLEKGATPAVGPARPGDPSPTVGDAPPAEREEASKFLTPADVNVIRQLEWNQSDPNVRVRLKGDVKKRFVDYKALDTRQFNAMTPVDQGWAILREGTPEMAKDVEIVSDPLALAEYRRAAVQPKILAGCASAGCHNSSGAGGFQLFTPADNEVVSYTNFFILQNYSKNIGGRVYSMIDRAAPDNSLLVQFGLPAELAEVDHPAVGSYRGIFKNRADPTYKAVTSWMGKTLNVVVPDYGINYKAPTSQPTAASATQPAAK